MLVSLVNQALKERGRAYLALCIGLIIYLGLTLGVYPILAASGDLDAGLAKFNRMFFWGVSTPSMPAVDWLNLTGFAAVLPLAISIAGMVHACGWIPAAQNGNQLALLLSYPISRRRMFELILLIQAGFLTALAMIAAAVNLVGSAAGWLDIPPLRILSMALNLAVFALFFSFLTILAGNLSGNLWIGLAAGAGALLFSALIYLLPGFTSLPAWLRWLSPLAAYLEGNPLLAGFHAVNWLGSAGWTLAAGLAAWLQFERLDVNL